MKYKFGIIGLPNVGKSALFNKITKLNVPSKNFPFCTIQPNIGIVPVIDKRLKKIAFCVSTKDIIYSFVKLIDIAGLVKGASKGEGLGNNFLEKVRECNALIHVVRCFKNDDITHVYNDVNPLRDIDIINTELLLSDLDLCKKIIDRLSSNKVIKHFDKNFVMHLIQRCVRHLQTGLFLRDVYFKEDELKQLKQYSFLTFKPIIYVLNITHVIDLNIDLNKLLKKTKIDKSIIFPVIVNDIHANKTHNIVKLAGSDNINYLNCDEIIKMLCNVLGLKTFFTAGPKEVRSWIFKNGQTAHQASSIIHTDFFKGFIRAQVISYNDFIQLCDINKIKRYGKIRSEGKQYIVQDGDIINFLFNI